jgi:flagellar biosynthesis GTPase FlhF
MTMTETKMSAIDRALAAAKARKAAKEAAGITEDTNAEAKPTKAAKPAKEKPVKTPKAAKEPKAKANDEAKEAAKAERAAAREARKAEKLAAKSAEEAAKAEAKAQRAAERAAKKAEKEAAKSDKKPAHMKKVERARAKLGSLNNEAEKIFSEVVSNFGVYEIELIAEHLMVHARAYKTQRALTQTQLPLGSTVTITGGDRRYIGMTGKVVHSQKLRAKVEVEGVAKPVYIYTGEAKVVTEQLLAVAV